MSKLSEKLLLFITDFIAINLAFFVWAWLRREEGFFSVTEPTQFTINSLVIFGYWFAVFLVAGLYKSYFARSRVDEFIRVAKAITIGVLLIYILTMDLQKDLERPFVPSRMMILAYWFLLLLFVSHARILVRTLQRHLLEAGVGAINTLIVGWSNEAWQLFDQLQRYPALGYNVVGFVSNGKIPARPAHQTQYKGRPLLASLEEIGEVIKQNRVQEVLIALEKESKEGMAQILNYCSGHQVRLKVLPDLYDVLIGRVRTNQIYGLPLVEILPGPLSLWQRFLKRTIDIAVSLTVLLLFMPVWIVVTVAIRVNSPGPIFFTQERLGKDGKVFKIIKFRSMYHDAESQTGPMWAEKDDPRVTPVGRIIRRLHIDEVPQFINVLKGDMSIVGPRPERPFFVEQLQQRIPLYSQRLRVRPGITGWAQIKGKYDNTLEDVRRKLQYDLFYLENLSVRLDMKIILNTLYVMLTGKGQ